MIIHSHLRLVEQEWANRIKSYVNDQATRENPTLETLRGTGQEREQAGEKSRVASSQDRQ
jgi:hypothetical protein